MNPELKAKWIEALRSGKYLQGERRLRTLTSGKPDTYCCLGVLGDIFDPSKWVPHAEDEGRMAYEHPMSGSMLSNDTCEATGIANVKWRLAAMNDGSDGIAKHSFEEIATWIEENL